MPDIITHYIFGLDTAHALKDSPLLDVLKENRDLFLVGLQGPDPIFYHKLRKKESKNFIATKMHTEKTGDFLVSALCHIKKYPSTSIEFKEGISYLSGFMCHYILDSMTHPYIFYLGGRYIESAPETHKYKGLHKKIEVAIDCILCEEKLNIKANCFKVHKQILSRNHLPLSLLTLFDETLFLLYGLNNGGSLMEESFQDIKHYFQLTYDRFGTKKALTSVVAPVLPKQIAPFATTFSYYNCLNSTIDYMNKGKKVWLHPVTGNVYTHSFYDLLRNSQKKSVALLLAAYAFLYSEITADELRSYLPNVSYSTGLSCEDTRPMKYFSPQAIYI